MRCITVQHIAVLDELNTTGVYHADISRVAPNLVAPYQKIMQFYQFEHCPIFLSVVGRRAEMYGARTGRDYVALEFEVPDDIAKYQDYYDWCDLIFWVESPKEFDPENFNAKLNIHTVEDYANFVFRTGTIDTWRAVQAVVPELRKEWLLYTTRDLHKLEDRHIGSGGANMLLPLSSYGKVDTINEPDLHSNVFNL